MRFIDLFDVKFVCSLFGILFFDGKLIEENFDKFFYFELWEKVMFFLKVFEY